MNLKEIKKGETYFRPFLFEKVEGQLNYQQSMCFFDLAAKLSSFLRTYKKP